MYEVLNETSKKVVPFIMCGILIFYPAKICSKRVSYPVRISGNRIAVTEIVTFEFETGLFACESETNNPT